MTNVTARGHSITASQQGHSNLVLFSKTPSREWEGVAPLNPSGRISRSTCQTTPGHNYRNRGRGASPPSPASQHVAVSGGVLSTRLTAACCEAVLGGDRA